MRHWLQLAIVFFVAISLIAAPCKNCTPKAQSETQKSTHDCCPKPKPQKSESCAWQPAAFDAVETKSDISIDAPAVMPVLATIELQLASPLEPRILSLTPPLVLSSFAVLRI